ncbi:MAG: transposase, partial [Christensenellaceae bacterium]|nr:transposase [Christensenellaceae bacterium]
MSFVSKSLVHPDQLALVDRYEDLDPYVKEVIENSWATDFREHVYLKIDESYFKCLYSDAGRPCVSIRFLISVELLKHLFNLSDKEIRATCIADSRFRHAVDSTGKIIQLLCERTLNRFRARILKYQEETGIDLITLATRDILDDYMSLTYTSPE